MKRALLLLFIPILLFTNPVLAKEADIQDEIFYDILIDRFNIGDHDLSDQVRSDDPFAYHGGDLQGIIHKLDRIEKLGFTAIILSPIQENAKDGYHGYWIEDFYKVNQEFGTMDDLRQLIEEAHQRDIKVVLELVTNYVSLSHPFINETEKQDWFKQNQVKQTPATSWLENVAVLDQDHQEVEQYLIDVAKYWMNETNIDGFKLHDADQSSESFLNNLTQEIKRINPNFYLLAGVSEDRANTEMLYNNKNIDVIEDQELFEAMNEVFTQAGEPITLLHDIWINSEDQRNILFVDNKNTARFSNNFAEKGRNALTTWQLAFVYLYTTPGVPVIFQGSELPMYGPSYQESQYLVRFNATNPDIEEFHERISALRKEFKPLTHGDFEYVDSAGAMSVFKRSYAGETMYIAINNDNVSQTVIVKDIATGQELRGFLQDDLVREVNDGEYRINVPRESAEVFIVQEDTGINWLFIGMILGVFILFVGFIVYLTRQQKKESPQ